MDPSIPRNSALRCRAPHRATVTGPIFRVRGARMKRSEILRDHVFAIGSMENPWKIHGKSMENLWKIYGNRENMGKILLQFDHKWVV